MSKWVYRCNYIVNTLESSLFSHQNTLCSSGSSFEYHISMRQILQNIGKARCFFLHELAKICLRQCWGTKGRLRKKSFGTDRKQTIFPVPGPVAEATFFGSQLPYTVDSSWVRLPGTSMDHPHFLTFPQTLPGNFRRGIQCQFQTPWISLCAQPTQPDPQWHCWPPSTVSASHARDQGTQMLSEQMFPKNWIWGEKWGKNIWDLHGFWSTTLGFQWTWENHINHYQPII